MLFLQLPQPLALVKLALFVMGQKQHDERGHEQHGQDPYRNEQS